MTRGPRRWVAAMMAHGRYGDGVRAADEGGELSGKQVSAIRRGAEVMERVGGLLLADAVGLGKTRVALETARELERRRRRRGGAAQPILLVVPARLRGAWKRASEKRGLAVGRDVAITSHYQMSRQPWEGALSVCVVDEAHRFRNPQAARSQHLALLCQRAPPMLVTATPVCTELEDLRCLLGYFLSDEMAKSLVGLGLSAAFEAHAAGEFDLVELLEEVVIRRREPDFGPQGRPKMVVETIGYQPSEEELWVWRHLEEEVRQWSMGALEDSWPEGLLRHHLMRRWESSPEALRESLSELDHFHQRWRQALSQGKRLEREAFKKLFSGVRAEQEVFGFVYEGEDDVKDHDCRGGRSDGQRIRALMERVEVLCGGRASMVEAIAAKVVESQGTMLVFVSYRASAEAIFEAIKKRGGGRCSLGLISGDGAWATGYGRCDEQWLLNRFRASWRGGRSQEVVRALVATDCLAEGVNLQGCQGVVMADLPYSPVVLEQRIGRVVRPGEDVESVTLYLPRPRQWSESLGLRRRLRERVAAAQRVALGQPLARGAMSESGESDAGDGDGALAAITREERLWALVSGDLSDDVVGLMRRRGLDFEKAQALWVRVAVEGLGSRYLWLCCCRPSLEVQWRRSRLLRKLVQLSELDDEIEKVDHVPCGEPMWALVQRWMERREQQYRAIHLAPTLVGKGSAGLRAWRRLEQANEEGRLTLEPSRWEALRRRLVRVHPPALERALEEVLKASVEVEELVSFGEGLSGAPRHKEANGLRVVGALWV